MSADVPPVDPSEDSYEALYERAPCGFLSMKVNGTIIKVNQTFLELSGYSREDLIGKTFSSVLDKGSQLFYETRYIPVIRLQREAREVLFTLRRADGTTLPILVNSILVDDRGDDRELIRTAIFDSTARRDYELELLHSRQAAETSEARVRVLQDAASRFAETESEDQVANVLVDCAAAAFAAAAAALFLIGEDGTLSLAAGRSPIAPLVSTESLRPGPEAIRTGQFIALSNLEEAFAFSPEVSDALLASRHEAMTVIPLISDTGPIGVLACFYARGRTFDDNFAQLQTALARQAAQVLARLALQRQLQHAALHDQLTGLANRALLVERMDEALAGAARSQLPLSVLFLDLDGFKSINDYLGHVVGDSVLREVAARLRREVRQTDVIGRFGGDEFVIICPDTDEGAAVSIAERTRAAIAAPFAGLLPGFHVTTSIGVAVHGAGPGDLTSDGLLTKADEAMYRSKNAGKDCVTVVRA